MNNSENSKEEIVTLPDFIEKYQKTIAVIGVFIAIASFLLKLPLQSLSIYLAFLSLLVTIPLFFELYRFLLTNKTALPLKIFSNILSIFVGYFLWYILVTFRDQWRTELERVVFWIVVLSLYFGIYKKFLKGRIKDLFLEKLKRLIRVDERSMQESFQADKEKIIAQHKTEFRKTLEANNTPQKDIPKRLEEYEKNQKHFLSLSKEEQLAAIQDPEKKESLRKVFEDDEKFQIKSKKRDKLADDLFFGFLTLVFLLIFSWLVSNFISKPVAAFINTGLDMVNESYQKSEQEHKSQTTPYVPPVNSNSNQ